MHAREKSLMPIVVMLAVALSVTGCGTGSSQSASASTGGGGSSSKANSTSGSSQVLKMPARTGTYMDWSKTVYNNQMGGSIVQEPITIVGPGAHPKGAAATSWSVSKNKLTWTFHLRHLLWSNGTPLTAKDYVFAFQRSANPKTGYDFGWFWGTVVGIKNWNKIAAGHLPPTALGVTAPNAYTLQVTTKSPVPFLPSAMIYAFPDPIPMVKKYGAAWATRASTMLASGPYMVKKWVQHQYIEFVPNPYYHGIRPHHLKKVLFYLVPQTDFSGFQTNQVDWTILNQGQLRAVQASGYPGARLITMRDYQINMLGFNVNVKPLNSTLVRKAISLAINKKVLVDSVLKGMAKPDTSVVPYGFPGYDPHIKEPYNIALAQKLLAQAGYPHGKGFPTLTLQLRNEPATIVTTKPAAEYIQSELRKNLGVNIQIKILDMPTWIANVNAGKAQMFIRPYNYDYMDPSDWYSLFLPGGVMTWNNPQFNRLVTAANASFHPAQRAALYNQSATVLNQNTGAVFLWSDITGYLVRNNVKKFPTTPVQIAITGNWIPHIRISG